MPSSNLNLLNSIFRQLGVLPNEIRHLEKRLMKNTQLQSKVSSGRNSFEYRML